MNTDQQNYRRFIIDDCDSSDGDGDEDGDCDGGALDTKWITEYETRIMTDEYRLFLKSDITLVGFEFFYLDRDKKCVERIIPNTMYSLKCSNQITQNEIFSVVQSHQKVDKKYYNFQSLLLYQIDFQYNTNDIVRGLSEYIRPAGAAAEASAGSQFIEYTNLLSIDVIYFPPVITMFHDFIGFSVLLYED
jgi:hypothetical protein